MKWKKGTDCELEVRTEDNERLFDLLSASFHGDAWATKATPINHIFGNPKSIDYQSRRDDYRFLGYSSMYVRLLRRGKRDTPIISYR